MKKISLFLLLALSFTFNACRNDDASELATTNTQKQIINTATIAIATLLTYDQPGFVGPCIGFTAYGPKVEGATYVVKSSWKPINYIYNRISSFKLINSYDVGAKGSMSLVLYDGENYTGNAAAFYCDSGCKNGLQNTNLATYPYSYINNLSKSGIFKIIYKN